MHNDQSKGDARPTWDDTFLDICEVVAKRSKDRNTKVGAVIVGPDNEIRSTGYNSFPRGILDNLSSRQERPAKYLYFEHAERNAIYNASRIGVSLRGCRVYIPWLPCAECARAIIQVGICQVVVREAGCPPHWRDNCLAGLVMLREAQVVLRLPNLENNQLFSTIVRMTHEANMSQLHKEAPSSGADPDAGSSPRLP
jgi:dCMP deaminase